MLTKEEISIKPGFMYYVDEPDVDALIVKVLELNSPSKGECLALTLYIENPKNPRFQLGAEMVINMCRLIPLRDYAEFYLKNNPNAEIVNCEEFFNHIYSV